MSNEVCCNEKNCIMINKEHVTINDIVQCYEKRALSCLHKEIKYYEDIKYKQGFIKVVENAAEALTIGGKIHKHQRRIPKKVIDKAKIILPPLKDKFEKTHSFEELYSIIHDNLIKVTGIGVLYIYDAALRIGVTLKYYPKEIYLHCGPKIGAKYLGIRRRKKVLHEELLNMYPAFATLESYEIENCLCVCRNAIKRIK